MTFKYQYPVIPEQIFSIIRFSEQEAVYNFVKSLSDNSIIVEVGSALGGTSCLIAAANPTFNVVCIDCLSNNYMVDIWKNVDQYGPIQFFGLGDAERHSINNVENLISVDPNGQLAFEYITKPYTNITLHKGYSPKDFGSWNKMIDVYFEDAVHENPILNSNIEFWKKFVKPGGYIIGHDYDAELYPDVVNEFNKLIQQGWIKVSLTDTLIILQKSLNYD